MERDRPGHLPKVQLPPVVEAGIDTGKAVLNFIKGHWPAMVPAASQLTSPEYFGGVLSFSPDPILRTIALPAAFVGEKVAETLAERRSAAVIGTERNLSSFQKAALELQYSLVFYLGAYGILQEAFGKGIPDRGPLLAAGLAVSDDVLGKMAEGHFKEGNVNLSILRLLVNGFIFTPIILNLSRVYYEKGDYALAISTFLLGVTNLEQALSSMPEPEELLSGLVRNKIAINAEKTQSLRAELIGGLERVNIAMRRYPARRPQLSEKKKSVVKKLRGIDRHCKFWGDLASEMAGGVDTDKDGVFTMEELKGWLKEVAQRDPDMARVVVRLWKVKRMQTLGLTFFATLFSGGWREYRSFLKNSSFGREIPRPGMIAAPAPQLAERPPDF